jgi:hypothetical protein
MCGNDGYQLPKANSVLVRGDGELKRTFELVVESERTGVCPLFVTTRGGAGERLVEAWHRVGGEFGSGPVVVDIGETVRSAVSGTSEPVDRNSIIRGPGDDLASARRAVETFLAEHEGSSPVAVIVDSLSSLLDERDFPAAVVFLDELLDTLGQDAVGYVLLDREADADIADTVRPLFDLTVDVGSEEDEVAFRSHRSLVPPETAFDLLGPSRRRHAVRTLLAADGSMSLDDLADELTAVEEFPNRERCRVALLHIDVPRLERAGVLRHDPATDVLETLGPAAGLRPYLALTGCYDEGRWGRRRGE